MTRRPWNHLLYSTALAAGLLALAACSAAAPPKPPPPPIQADARPPGEPGDAAASLPAVPTSAAAAPARSVPMPPPTLPPVVVSAAAAAPTPLLNQGDDELPSARQIANGMVAALGKANSARLLAKLPNQHQTDVVYVAPDRAAVIELDVNGQEAARYVIIGDTGYSNLVSTGTGWSKVINEGYRKQSQIFRPMQIALATGKPRLLDSGVEVEWVEFEGRLALRAEFDYSSSQELQDLGLMRSAGNLLEIVVDPTTWLPWRTREVTQGSVTEVTFVGFDQPVSIDPPIS